MTEKLNELGVAARDASSKRNTSATRALLACGLIAGPLFMGIVVIQLLTRPGFDLGRHALSMLSIGGFGWIQRANFVGSGILAVAFAIGIRWVLHPGRAGTWGPILVGTFGVGLIVAGIFVVQPALGFPPGTPDGVATQMTWQTSVHGLGFMLANLSLIVACMVLARRYVALRMRGWAAYSTATAAASIALVIWPSQDSASIRYFVAALIVWIWTSATAAHLRRAHDEHGHIETRHDDRARQEGQGPVRHSGSVAG